MILLLGDDAGKERRHYVSATPPVFHPIRRRLRRPAPKKTSMAGNGMPENGAAAVIYLFQPLEEPATLQILKCVGVT